MPPKRKAISTNGELNSITTKKTRTTKKTQKTSKDQKSFDKVCQNWFNKYKDQDNTNIIGPDGCQTFFSDIDVSLESIFPILIAWKMNCSRMGYITMEEWNHGMKESNESKLKKELNSLEKLVEKDESLFKKIYLYTFPYAKSEGQKSMQTEVAVALWQILLVNRYPIVQSFIQFIEEKKPVKVINKDQWASLLDFCKSIPEDLSGYDAVSSCFLIKEKLNHNISIGFGFPSLVS
ncbi:hypothetical protein RO3G_06323 [Rhizopus delemar RA 99-880]|uniref:Defective in cullin neddylation protein n=1 Tax=Rhizopus delemar (strain RA 99-880 / ATCC MYA-4621 / FGSC 9543 / NRRL 43880) TaxID=246409 RepID=I1BZI8_RHIO9|nr:hypothetical protein RO3G_06323 [Rhizopus delemar RA 99-880]|eukprot:EIE81618.1 hypothetical protein RO3G_06323 [Rhizopus delemar RA 99-880]